MRPFVPKEFCSNPVNRKSICIFIFKFLQVIITQAAITAIKERIAADDTGTVYDKAFEHFFIFTAETHSERKAAVIYGNVISFHFNTLYVFYNVFDFVRVINIKTLTGVAVKNRYRFLRLLPRCRLKRSLERNTILLKLQLLRSLLLLMKVVFFASFSTWGTSMNADSSGSFDK